MGTYGRRQLVTLAFREIVDDEKGTYEPTPEDIKKRHPKIPLSLITNTLRIIKIIRMSGKETLSGVRQWQDEQKTKNQPKELTDGFSTEGGQEILDALTLAIPEIVPGDETGGAANDDIADGPGREGPPQAVAQIDAATLWEKWRSTVEIEKAQARKDERAIADAQLQQAAAERAVVEARLEAEQQKSVALVATERAQAAAQASAQRSQSRLYAMIAILAAMVVGVVCGVAWSRSHGQQPQGVQPAESVQPGERQIPGIAKDPVLAVPKANEEIAHPEVAPPVAAPVAPQPEPPKP